jgi:hypothetical protein
VLILIGPGVWVASYWHEFYLDASDLEARWLCMTVASGRMTVSYNDDDVPPSPSGGTFPSNPYQLHQVMFSTKRILIGQFRGETQQARLTLEARLKSERSSRASYNSIRARLDELGEYAAAREKEHAAWHAAQRKVASHWLNEGLSDEVWYVDATSTRGIVFAGPAVGFILHVHLIVPLGLFCIVAIIVRGIVQRARARREQEGLCESCGYNLTGNTSGVCPECGTPVPETTTIPNASTVQEA